MSESYINKFIRLVSFVWVISVIVWTIKQINHLGDNFLLFSFSNIVNDSIFILVTLWFILIGIYLSLLIITRIYSSFEKDSLGKSKALIEWYHLFIHICLLMFLYYYYQDINHFEISIYTNLNALILILLKAILYSLSYFLLFIYLQKNIFNLIEIFSSKNQTTKGVITFIIFDIVLLVIWFFILNFILNDSKVLTVLFVSIVVLLFVWNTENKFWKLEFSNLISEKYVIIYTISLIIFYWIIGWSSTNLFENRELCFINNDGIELKIEYMNDKYIFTESGKEIYKNNINKFFVCE